MKFKKIFCCVMSALALSNASFAFAVETEQQTQTIENDISITQVSGEFVDQQQYRVGDVIGTTLITDIAAYINHHPIESHNVEGYICIPADELNYYGFDVEWNAQEKSLNVTKTNKQFMGPPKTVFRKDGEVGTPNLDIYYTDIKTYINGNLVRSFNVGGRTLIYFDDLAAFGKNVWVPEVRALKLWVEGIPVAPFKYVPYENMYKTYPQSNIPDFSDVTGAKLELKNYSNGIVNYKYPYDKQNIEEYISELEYLNFEVTQKDVDTAVHYNAVKENNAFVITADEQKELLWVVCIDKGEQEVQNYPCTGLVSYTSITGVPVEYTVYFSGLPSVYGFSADGEGFTYKYNSKDFERYLYHIKKNGYTVETSGYNEQFKEIIYSVFKPTSNPEIEGDELYQIIVQAEKKLMCVRTMVPKPAKQTQE